MDVETIKFSRNQLTVRQVLLLEEARAGSFAAAFALILERLEPGQITDEALFELPLDLLRRLMEGLAASLNQITEASDNDRWQRFLDQVARDGDA